MAASHIEAVHAGVEILDLSVSALFYCQNKLDYTDAAHEKITDEFSYWRITIENTGDYGIVMELEGDVSKIEAGESKVFCSEEAWEPGTYAISFACTGAQGMEGSVVCERATSFLSHGQTDSMTIKHDLRNGDIELAAADLENYVFFTNSTKIAVTVKGNSEFRGEIILTDAGNAKKLEINFADVDSKNAACLFENLTSACLYGITFDGLDGCTLLISSDD